ncbi:MAG: ABC transporter substrate-binding protein [Alphaproteobacteria bacterium]
MKLRNLSAFAAVAALSAISVPAQGAEKINFILNWVAGGDHAPIYWAEARGLYKQGGIDLTIEQGKGSTLSSQRVGIGKNQLGIADLGTALVAKGSGADVVGVMNIYANSPYGMYWLKSSGIKSVKDFAGRKIGNPAWDAARKMWPALAKATGVDPKSVKWVNVAPNAKLAALKSKNIDITTSFYNIHFIFQRVLGDDMGFLPWRDHGINPYGNSIIANGKYLEANKDTVAKFVKITQKAYADCVKTPVPCVDALVKANSGLKTASSMKNWELVTELMNDATSRTVALGHFDDGRMGNDYKMVETYFNLKQPFDIRGAYTNAFLDGSVKFPSK